MNADLLVAHYGRIADAPDAVARLRRFILDLAVRGKLVPQDPKDEPAFESLKRMTNAKARLDRKERRPRRPTQPNVRANGKGELPGGWALAPLSDLVTVLNGRAYKESELLNAGTPILRVGNLFTSNKWYYSDLRLDDDKYCDKGDLIFAWSASFGPFIWSGGRVIYHYHIWKLQLHSEADLDKLYLYNFLLQKTREIKGAGHGISMIHMTKEKMEQIEVPLPPVAEQHRIVVKVDELMALCDRLEVARAQREATRDRLTVACLARLNVPDSKTFQDEVRFALNALLPLTSRPEQIKQIRQTILNLAVRGKLVSQDPNDEPASELLKRARDAKRRAWELSHAEKTRANATKQSRMNRKSRYEPPAPASRQPGFGLPSGWGWAVWREVGTCQNGRAFPSGEYSDTGIRLLRPGNLFENGSVVWTPQNTRFLPQKWANEYPEFMIGESEIVMNLTAQSLNDAFLGRACITGLGERSLLNQRIARLTPFATTPSFTLWLLKSSAFRDYVDGGLNQGALIQHMFTSQVEAFEFALPPLAEQHRIVAKIDGLMELCDRLEASLITGSDARRRLLDALLHEALAPVDQEAA